MNRYYLAAGVLTKDNDPLRVTWSSVNETVAQYKLRSDLPQILTGVNKIMMEAPRLATVR